MKKHIHIKWLILITITAIIVYGVFQNDGGYHGSIPHESNLKEQENEYKGN